VCCKGLIQLAWRFLLFQKDSAARPMVSAANGECPVDRGGSQGRRQWPRTAVRARASEIQVEVNRSLRQAVRACRRNRGLTNEAMRGTDAAIYRGELAIRAGLADRVGTLDLAIAEMAAEFDRVASRTNGVEIAASVSLLCWAWPAERRGRLREQRAFAPEVRAPARPLSRQFAKGGHAQCHVASVPQSRP
jgi:hypothetical protein